MWHHVWYGNSYLLGPRVLLQKEGQVLGMLSAVTFSFSRFVHSRELTRGQNKICLNVPVGELTQVGCCGGFLRNAVFFSFFKFLVFEKFRYPYSASWSYLCSTLPSDFPRNPIFLPTSCLPFIVTYLLTPPSPLDSARMDSGGHVHTQEEHTSGHSPKEMTHSPPGSHQLAASSISTRDSASRPSASFFLVVIVSKCAL